MVKDATNEAVPILRADYEALVGGFRAALSVAEQYNILHGYLTNETSAECEKEYGALCGSQVCAEIGCITLKLECARAILAKVAAP